MGLIEIFARETSRSLALYFHHSFFGSWARTVVIFSAIATVLGVWGRCELVGYEFPLSLTVVGLCHGVDNYCWPVTVVTVL